MTPLTDVRVLDLSRLIPGPFATLVLADLGATVDKVEDPGAGDYLRVFPPLVADDSGAFHALNRGKRSLVLDLKRPEGVATLKRMLGSYDVLFEQFRPGVLDRLGLGHADLQREFPRLVICALTGYGQTGPLARRAGHDLDYLARAGLLGFQGPSDRPPAVPGFQLADVAGGLWSALGIVAALRERDRTGRGTTLDIAMTDGVLGFASAAFGSLFGGEMPTRGSDLLNGGIAAYQTYVSSDGAPFALAALEPKFWLAFCAATGLEPSLEALVPGAHQVAWKAKVAALFATKTRAEWIAFAQAHDCCLEPVLAPDELRADPHLAARELFFEVERDGQKIPQFRLPITPRDRTFSPAPKRGEHADAILAEAGLAPDEIAALRRTGALGLTQPTLLPGFGGAAYALRPVETLAAYVAKFGALDAGDALGWALRLARRIERLHGLGIPHGNLSLKSVSVEGASPRGPGVLTWTKPGENVQWRSPERGPDGSPSLADDTWSLALMTYALLAGRNPFEAIDAAQAQRRAAAAQLPTLRTNHPMAIEIGRLLERALEKDPSRRLSALPELRAGLERMVGPQASALPPLEEEEDDAPTMVKPSDAASLRQLVQAKVRPAPPKPYPSPTQPMPATTLKSAPSTQPMPVATQPMPVMPSSPSMPAMREPPLLPSSPSMPAMREPPPSIPIAAPSMTSMPSMPSQQSMPSMPSQQSMPSGSIQQLPSALMPPAVDVPTPFLDPARERRITTIAVCVAVTIGLFAGVAVGMIGR